jgi:hypothetical protein
MSLEITYTIGYVTIVSSMCMAVAIFVWTLPPELGKVTLKSNGDEALSDESP